MMMVMMVIPTAEQSSGKRTSWDVCSWALFQIQAPLALPTMVYSLLFQGA